jgi:predicted small lipoprotein YifL
MQSKFKGESLMNTRHWLLLVLTLLGALNLAACEREGPLERTGEEVDEAGRAIQDSAREGNE